MCVVIAIKHQGAVYMGCTSYFDDDIEIEDMSKSIIPIWEDKTQALNAFVGHAGSFKQGIACSSAGFLYRPDMILTGLDQGYIENYVLFILKILLTEGGTMKEEDSYDNMQSDFIVANKDRLFLL